LNVYDASVRGNVGKGIGNLEFGYYESDDDQGGKNGNINNSELRFLAGYSQEIGKDFTAGLQYYVEHMLDYSQHKNSSPSGLNRDRDRHLITVRLTKLLMNQNLRCSLFTYFSPSDKDVYMRPNINYKVNDNLAVEAGADIFFGDYFKPARFVCCSLAVIVISHAFHLLNPKSLRFPVFLPTFS